jgi:succinate dehydrogenase/fumarate reductase flavoprotein subunit
MCLRPSGLDFDMIGLITGHKAEESIAHYSHKRPGSVALAAAAFEGMSAKRDRAEKLMKKKKQRPSSKFDHMVEY